MSTNSTQKKGAIIINNEVHDPIGEYMINYLFAQTKETAFFDFKWTMNIKKNSDDFPKIIKDVYAFSNYGGGWLVLGIKQNDHVDHETKSKFIKVGLPNDYEIDDASLQEKINSYLDEPISIQYVEFNRTINDEVKKFALLYFSPSSKIMTAKNDVKYSKNGKEKIAVHKNIIYIRRGTQSIIASSFEENRIKSRLLNENYRLSIISGEPDEINETIHSNLFEVLKIPKKVYTGILKYNTFDEMIKALQIIYPNKLYFELNFRQYKNKLITFENLKNQTNIHNKLVKDNEINQESTINWINDSDKKRIILSLMNKEVINKAELLGMRYDKNTHQLFYPIFDDDVEKKVEWPTRYKGVQKKQVVKKIFNNELNKYIYIHATTHIQIMNIGTKFYLRLNPTLMVSENGKKSLIGMRIGAIITGQTYRMYNKQQLNNVLFWINKIGNGSNIFISDDFIISNKPIQTNMNVGISWDIPTMDLKMIIEKFDSESETMNRDSEMSTGDNHDL